MTNIADRYKDMVAENQQLKAMYESAVKERDYEHDRFLTEQVKVYELEEKCKRIIKKNQKNSKNVVKWQRYCQEAEDRLDDDMQDHDKKEKEFREKNTELTLKLADKKSSQKQDKEILRLKQNKVAYTHINQNQKDEIEKLKQESEASKQVHLLHLKMIKDLEKKLQQEIERKVSSLCDRIVCEDNIGHLIKKLPQSNRGLVGLKHSKK
tara:strand:- start:2622 stop:3248 length:627 start_codon:yes stop_codon:yes gene_type:complete